MKRFYQHATVQDRAVLLDGRPVRTPARAALALPTDLLAGAVAAEWQRQGEEIDPRSMPLTGLANAAIDRVAADPAGFADGLARYGESDLLCYRAGEPASLAARQAAAWDPLLAWARDRYGAGLLTAVGVVHRSQPADALAALREALAALDPFRLAGLSPLVTIGGSLVAALAVHEGATTPEMAWDAVTVDERWQAEQWGSDDEAVRTLAARRDDWDGAAWFLALLG